LGVAPTWKNITNERYVVAANGVRRFFGECFERLPAVRYHHDATRSRSVPVESTGSDKFRCLLGMMRHAARPGRFRTSETGRSARVLADVKVSCRVASSTIQIRGSTWRGPSRVSISFAGCGRWRRRERAAWKWLGAISGPFRDSETMTARCSAPYRFAIVRRRAGRP